MSESHKSYFAKVARRLLWYTGVCVSTEIKTAYSVSLNSKLARSTVNSVRKERPPSVVLWKLAKLRLIIQNRRSSYLDRWSDLCR